MAHRAKSCFLPDLKVLGFHVPRFFMSQSSSVESPTQAFSNPSLNPALQVALASMDVQLDAELARYRRESKKHPPLKVPTSPAQIPEGRVQIAPPDPAIAGNGNGNGTLLPDAAAPSTPPDALPSASNDAPTSTNALPADASTDPAQTPPQDYLKSSAALLNSKDSATTSETPEPKNNGMLSPLGIGSILLFLLATATLGYVAFNPSSLNYLGLARLLGKSDPQTTATVPAAPEAPPSATAGKLPASPDLSSQEFPNLTLDTLSGINPNPNPAPTATTSAKPAPAAPAAAPQPAGTASSLSNLSTVLSPGSTPAKPANSGGQPPKPVVDDRYYNLYFVVAKYDKPETLAKAQQSAPEAYLRKFPVGDRIQLGAFDNSNSAQQLVDRLREKGITAEVYKPE
jgi:SPOR domain